MMRAINMTTVCGRTEETWLTEKSNASQRHYMFKTA